MPGRHFLEALTHAHAFLITRNRAPIPPAIARAFCGAMMSTLARPLSSPFARSTARDRSIRWSWLSSRYFTLVLLTIALPFICLAGRPLFGDVWWVMASGQEMVRQGQLLQTDVFTFSPHTSTYVDAQWLAQLAYYGAYRLLGLEGVAVFNALVGTLAFGLLWHLAWRRSQSAPVAALCTLFAVLNALWFIHPRAQTLALATFAATFWLLGSPRPGARTVIGLGAVEAIWANLHGSFFLGPLLTLAILAGEAGDALLQGNRPAALVRSRRLRFLAVAAAAQIAGSLLNPYGPSLYRYAVALSSDPVIRGHISEWLPTTATDVPQSEFFASVALMGLALGVARRRVALADMFVLVPFAVLGLQANRNIPWWGLVCAPILASYLVRVPVPASVSRLGRYFIPSQAHLGGNLHRAALIGLVLVGSLPWAKAANPVLPAGQRTMTAEVYPVQAVNFLTSHDYGRHIFNQHPWGAYLDWQLWPRYQPMIDPSIELHPADVWFDVQKLNVGHASWEELLDKYGVDVLLLSQEEQAQLIEAVRRSPRWQSVYHDDLAQVYVRTAEARL